jgi:hypothetical protein
LPSASLVPPARATAAALPSDRVYFSPDADGFESPPRHRIRIAAAGFGSPLPPPDSIRRRRLRQQRSELRMGRAKSKGAKFSAVKKIISKKTIKK